MDKGCQLIDPELKKEMSNALGIAHISDKTAIILDMVSKGHEIDFAHKLVTGKDRITDSTRTHLKQKSQKWLLNQPSMQKLAHNAVKETLQMKPITTDKGLIYPRVSDRLAAASMVADRVEPVKGNQGSHTVNLFIDKVQVNKFQAQHVDHNSGMDNGSVIECSNISELGDD